MIPISKPCIGPEEVEAVKEVVLSGNLAQGEKVEEFEEAFARYIGTKYAVAVSSGTAALHLALLAHGIGPGDEVITTPFSFVATANAVLFVGATPVFADIDEETFNIDPAEIEKKITPRTRAVIPVHLYGNPCEMDRIMEIASRHDLIVIEDACQAHGAEYKGKKVGSFGTGCFSFYPTKNMTCGEGGMVTTDDPLVADRVRLLRSHGQRKRYYHETLGYNLRMTDIAAAVGICQLRKLDQFNERRMANASALTEALQHILGIRTPKATHGAKHVFHQYTVRVSDTFSAGRDALIQKLSFAGVGTGVYYPLPIHQQQPFKERYRSELCPKAELACSQVLSLPIHPAIRQGEICLMADVIRSAYRCNDVDR